MKNYKLVSVEMANEFMANLPPAYKDWNNYSEEDKENALFYACFAIFNDPSVIFKYSVQQKGYKDETLYEAIIFQAYHSLTDHEEQFAQKNQKNGLMSFSTADYSANYNPSTQLYPIVYNILMPILVRVGRF